MPAWLHAAIVRGLRPDQRDRHPSLRALFDALTADERERRRRRVWLPIAGVAALLAITAGVVIVAVRRVDEREELCRRGPDRLVGIWDDARRNAIRAAFVATGKPYAGDLASAVERSFDRYRDDWLAAYQTICETTLHGEQSPELRDQGKHAEASAQYRRALAIVESALGADSREGAELLASYGYSLNVDGHHEEALAICRRSLAIREKTLDADHPDVALSLNNVAAAEIRLGRYDEALADLQRATAISARKLGPDHPNMAIAENSLGDVYAKKHDGEHATAHYQRALQIWEKALGPDHAQLAAPLTGLGKVALARGRAPAALPLLERALTLREAAHGDPADFARTQFALARAVWEVGGKDRARALDLAEKARAALAAGGKGATGDLAEVEVWLKARAH